MLRQEMEYYPIVIWEQAHNKDDKKPERFKGWKDVILGWSEMDKVDIGEKAAGENAAAIDKIINRWAKLSSVVRKEQLKSSNYKPKDGENDEATAEYEAEQLRLEEER